MININSKVAKTFLILFLFMIPSVIFVGGTIPYFLFYVLLLTFIVPFLHSYIAIRSIKGSVDIPNGSLYKGDTININYKLENKSPFSIPYLEIHSDIARKLTGKDALKVIISLEQKRSYFYNEEVLLLRRGYYEMGEIEIIIYDIFRFFIFKKKINTSISLLVYPETTNLSTFEITANQQLGELLMYNSIYQDKSRISSIRDYREGDVVKSIHWKLTAKRNHPIVKEYETRVDTNVIIFIDNQKYLFENDNDRRIEDKIVDIALSIVNYCLNQNIDIILETQTEEKFIEINGQNPNDLKQYLEIFARFKGNGTLNSKTLLTSRIERIIDGSAFIIVTPNLDKGMGTIGLQLKSKNLNPLFIVVTDNENNNGFVEPLVESRLKQEGIPLFILDCKSNVKDVLEAKNG